jgi:hypothetical protein
MGVPPACQNLPRDCDSDGVAAALEWASRINQADLEAAVVALDYFRERDHPATFWSHFALGTFNSLPILIVGISPRAAAAYEALRLNPSMAPASGTS